ncbi:hypothetical protein PsorP6_016873 [Peronosclerospora sorghi]|uniref:Uncharacterized protein n=1 Tax=Peronosclerospora sorghi TaxID=230839 RepID=A0ACC0WG39_9STRA|nr:hypothetical protein PsorP6_016873 [Peronosclerospora sorghi]
MMTSPNDMDRIYSPTNNEASDVEAQQVPLAPPDEDLHATLGDAIHAIKMHTKQHGYGITQFKIAFDKNTHLPYHVGTTSSARREASREARE